MKKSDLKSNYYMYGNKGSVWSKKVHICESGSSVTLCEKPMLSNNWASLLEVEEIGCEDCIKKYIEKSKTLLEIINLDGEPNILQNI
jgi:hypothetical protein